MRHRVIPGGEEDMWIKHQKVIKLSLVMIAWACLTGVITITVQVTRDSLAQAHDESKERTPAQQHDYELEKDAEHARLVMRVDRLEAIFAEHLAITKEEKVGSRIERLEDRMTWGIYLLALCVTGIVGNLINNVFKTRLNREIVKMSSFPCRRTDCSLVAQFGRQTKGEDGEAQ